MQLRTKLMLIGAAIVGAALAPQFVQAGGIELYEIASPDIGLASAGYSARAQDASTPPDRRGTMSFRRRASSRR